MQMIAIATLSLVPILTGCAQLESAVTFLDAPSTQQAVLTLRTVATAAVCDISTVASLTANVATLVNKAKVSSKAGLVAVGSGTVCSALGGTLTGAVLNNAVAVAQ